MNASAIRHIVNTITEAYFVDPSKETVGDITIENWNVLMGVFTYIGRRNMLMAGRPGSGKTSLASIVSSVCSNLPRDLYDFLKIQGHADQTKDTMLARIDLGRLSEEGVVWQPSVYLPSITLDELNRLPPSKQNVMLEFIRTGAIEHLGKHFSRAKPAFFATINHNGPGTYPVHQATYDRFDIAIELTPGSSFLQDLIADASRRQKELANPEKTREIITDLLKKDISIDEKLAKLGRYEDAPDVRLPFTPHAKTLLACIWEEMNTTPLYGDNRPDDPVDTSSHNASLTDSKDGVQDRDRSYASSKITEGISHRAHESICYYTTMLASYLHHDHISIEHIEAVAPYCLAHRLRFTQDYIAKFEGVARERDDRKEMNLARRIISDIKQNYDDIHTDLHLMDAHLSGQHLGHEQEERLRQILAGPTPDHPLMRLYYRVFQ